MPVAGHPELEPGVPGMLLRDRPDPGPVRAAVSACTDQIKGLDALTEFRCAMVLEQYDGTPVPASEGGPDPAGRLSNGVSEAGLGDNGQVTGLGISGQPDAQVRSAFPIVPVYKAARSLPAPLYMA